MSMQLVIALGGNALLRRGEPLEHAVQLRNIERAAEALAPVADLHQVVITHGNGPQVGLLSLQAEAYRGVLPYPLDVLDAESEGMIGYLLEQALGNRLPHREMATLLTQVLVRSDDPAFSNPTKPVGPVYPRAEAEQLALTNGWTIAPDGDGYRRVVASPEPQAIVEMRAIRALLKSNVIVICAGGGGIPVTIDARTLGLHGAPAVIDKDHASALLAIELKADMLLFLTDVAGVYRTWPAADGEHISLATVDEMRELTLPSGSMRPKVDAACRFVEATGKQAVIGSLDDAAEMLAGHAGTTIKGS